MTDLKCSEAARLVIGSLRVSHGELIFLISGGCCDNSAPLCFPKTEFKIGERDKLLGHVAGCAVYVTDIAAPFYTDIASFKLDVAEGRGGGFSLEAPMGVRFFNRA